MIISLGWTEFKARALEVSAYMQYADMTKCYSLWMQEDAVIYKCKLAKDGGEDVTEFENDYKADCNKPIKVVDEEGRAFVRAESKPTNMTTYFTSRGDSDTEIGGGTELSFNFNNTDDELEDAPSGFRQKRVVCSFIDTVRLKEGAIYWENMSFGSNIDLCLGIPNGGYYLTNTGELRQNTTGESLRVARFVKSSPMMGSCPMGDELNTETSSFDIPAGTLFGFTITVPSTVGLTDNCHGAVILELYRERTVILPDE